MVRGEPVAGWLLGWGNTQACPREGFGGFLEWGNWELGWDLGDGGREGQSKWVNPTMTQPMRLLASPSTHCFCLFQ